MSAGAGFNRVRGRNANPFFRSSPTPHLFKSALIWQTLPMLPASNRGGSHPRGRRRASLA